MEKIRIGKEKRRYEISSIRPESANVLEIVFTDAIPAIWGDITIYTDDGTEATTLYGYETMWKQEGSRVWLSNDGSVYTPPSPPEPAEPPEPYVPTLEEVRVGKKAEVSAACEQIIFAGINVTLSDGTTEHYSLTEHDQLNLFGKLSQISVGAAQLEYHADGQSCRYYTAIDMQAIIQRPCGMCPIIPRTVTRLTCGLPVARPQRRSRKYFMVRTCQNSTGLRFLMHILYR